MATPADFPDIADFDIQRQQLARRRKIAEEMMATRMPEARMQGNYAILPGAGNTLDAGFNRILGNYQNPKIDAEEMQNRMAEKDASDLMLSNIPASGPERTQAQIRAATRMPSLRDAIKMQMVGDEAEANRVAKAQEAEQNRIDKGEQLAADRVLKAEEGELNRQNRLDARATPTVHITNSGSGAGGYAGAAPIIGTNPRDETPVYRHTKSGQLFQYDDNGQPVEYAGAIGPKPVAVGNPTESERGAAGYLGRMQAAEQNLANAKPFSLPTQMGLDRAPNVTNFVLTPEQQVQRQQQEDWVRAKLRKESGAVIGDEEMAKEIRTYFPMAGDSDKVIASKRQSRAQAMEQMKSSAGRAKPNIAAPVPDAARVRVGSKAEFDALPAGTKWETPDGKRGTK